MKYLCVSKNVLLQGGFFLVGFVVLVLRRPESLLHPQFWAEDGAVWYASAYNFGWFNSMLFSRDSYFQTFPRMIAGIAQLIPLEMVPQFFYIIALSVYLLPALLIISSRAERIVPRLSIRLLLASIFIVLPNTAEIHGNITNSQWFLALSVFLILITPPVHAAIVRVFDVGVLALSGMSGPFCIFLLPIASLIRLRQPQRQTTINLFTVSAAAWAQLLALISNIEQRFPFVSEPSFLLYHNVLARRVVVGLLAGANGYEWLRQHVAWSSVLVSSLAAVGLLLVLYSLWRGPWELKYFILLSGIIGMFSLVFAVGYDPERYDSSSFHPMFYAGMRYWFIPMMMFVAVLVWGMLQHQHIIRFFSSLFLLTMLIGIVADFRHPVLPEKNFHQSIQQFYDAPSGVTVRIPVNPAGWEMILRKH